MEKFIELVIRGRIEGLEYNDEGGIDTPTNILTPPYGIDEIDHLCAHIRRWLSGKGWYWELHPHWIYVSDAETWGEHHDSFKEGSELDWHLQAAVWVCEREG